MADQPQPTLRRRELGHRLRELRHLLDLTLEQVAGRLMVSTTKISRIESGARGVSLRDVRDLCGIYGVSGDEVDRLMALARESKERAWWQEHDLPVTTYIGLEQTATAISEYSASVVPGLLQTEDYITALIEGMKPKLTADSVRQQVELRLARQRLLSEVGGPQLWVVVDEAALHMMVGGTVVMRGQLDMLTNAARMTNVHLQVMPFEAGAHPGLNSNFIILDLGRRDVSDVVYVEGLLGNIYLERVNDLERYRRIFDQLRAAALSPRQSVQRLQMLNNDHVQHQK
ncbi:MAG: helix-turn-helix domain-containing protein [Pseudonocardiaceae bacterium]